MASVAAIFVVFFIFNLASLQVFAAVVLEEGYTVTTVIDGHKLKLNPYAVLPRPGSSDLLVLDSSGSAFYTVSLPVSKSQEPVVNRFPSTAGEGYADGEAGSARFNKPRGSAVTQKGTVFVADWSNHVIRKISASGVSTMAGGYSLKPGHEDGPAQNATFSADFNLAFDADKCALLVSDRGNQLVRLISLKPEDCARSSLPSALGSVPVWIISLGLSCFVVGILVGLVVQPYIIPYEGSIQLGFCCSVTWKQCQIRLGKLAQTLCFAIRSATASSSIPVLSLLRRLFWSCISRLSLIFSINSVESQVPRKEYQSLLDLDVNNSSSSAITESSKYADQLRDLMPLELSSADSQMLKQDGEPGRSDRLSGCQGGIDGMIDSNIIGFVDEALGGSSGLVKRR